MVSENRPFVFAHPHYCSSLLFLKFLQMFLFLSLTWAHLVLFFFVVSEDNCYNPRWLAQKEHSFPSMIVVVILLTQSSSVVFRVSTHLSEQQLVINHHLQIPKDY